MAEKFSEIKTKTKVETDFEESESVKSFAEVNKKAYDAVFDNTHKTKKYEKVVSEIETQTLPSFQEDAMEEVVQKSETLDRTNPFFGDKNALQKLSKHSFKEVVDTPSQPEPKLEIKEKIVVSNAKTKQLKPESKRKKFWQITGIILIVLFLGLFGYNMISINNLAKKVAKMENRIHEQEQTLDDQTTPEQQIQDELQNGGN